MGSSQVGEIIEWWYRAWGCRRLSTSVRIGSEDEEWTADIGHWRGFGWLWLRAEGKLEE